MGRGRRDGEQRISGGGKNEGGRPNPTDESGGSFLGGGESVSLIQVGFLQEGRGRRGQKMGEETTKNQKTTARQMGGRGAH